VRGIISTLAFNPQHPTIYAAGTYSNHVLVLQEDRPASDAMLEIRDLPFSVTHLAWAPGRGEQLWIGGRNSNEVWCYDVRHTRRCLGVVKRSLDSNQRVTFDLDPWGKFLCTGDDKGSVLTYDAASFALLGSRAAGGGSSQRSGGACVNSVRFHPYCALMAVTAGQRIFEDEDEDEDEEGSGLSLYRLKSQRRAMPEQGA
jgi:hypothetical protein